MHSLVKKPCAEIYLSEHLQNFVSVNELIIQLEKYFEIGSNISSADLFIGTGIEKPNFDLIQILLWTDKEPDHRHGVFYYQPCNEESQCFKIDCALLTEFILTISKNYSIPVKARHTMLVTY